MDDFLPQLGRYRDLRCFQISEYIYDLTFRFCGKFLHKGDRTIDQMIQAARSGKQNIAEGSAAATTSKETEIKLTNVAKASLQELLLDYEDYLNSRNLIKWELDDPRLIQTRQVLRQKHDRQYFIQKSEEWSDQTMANVVITMLHQCDYLLTRLIESQKARFLKEGGIREAMSRARRAHLATQSPQRYQSPQSPPSSQSSPSPQSPPSPQTPPSPPSPPSPQNPTPPSTT